MFLTVLFVLLCSSKVLGEEEEDKRPLLACSDNSDITIGLKQGTTKWTNDGPLYYTSLAIDNLQNGATVCFNLKTPQGKTERYAVKLEEVSGAARFEDQYDFGVPNVTAKCTCSCSDNSNILKECNAEELGFCDGYGSDARCVTKNEETEVNKGCTGLQKDSDLCCAIQMKNSDITERFKAFKIRDQQQSFVKLQLYPSYSDLAMSPHVIDDLEETRQVQADNIQFKEVSVTREGSSDNQFLNPTSWYIGTSFPYSPTVYETSKEVNGKSDYDISKVGWAKFEDGAYQVGQDRIPDSKIIDAFTATVSDCGNSDITSAFDSIHLVDLKNTLKELKSKHSTYVEKISWENSGHLNHGKLDWTYKNSAYKIDLKFKLEGKNDDFEVERISVGAEITDFTAQVVVTEHGEAYIQYNLTESWGVVFGTYTLGGDSLEFTFEVTDNTSYSGHYTHTDLECNKNANGKLCLNVIDGPPMCKTILCNEKKIKESDIIDNEIISENVISEDPMNWRTWAKFANPLEWFNGISNYQEAIMLVVEVVGMFGTVFLVIKILKMLNLLGKCCRCMFCCFLCPKAEDKIRKRATTVSSNSRRRFTETKRRMTARSRKFTSSFKRNHRVTSDGSKEGRNRSFKETVRVRLTTAAAVEYLRRKVRGEPTPPVTNEYELEEGSKKIPTKVQENDMTCESEETTEEKGHVNVMFEEEGRSGEEAGRYGEEADKTGHVNEMFEEEEVRRNKPVTKTVSFK
ncbi:uncharacterized protein LOC134817816 [Bolinopsis microptera]|uniref:uncharacterized protein LOC134817816 n=1 Tax=Bolinopsis microptera TaxID=2820187 RepID=UPI0030790D06